MFWCDDDHLIQLKGYLSRANTFGEQVITYSLRSGKGRMFADKKLSIQSMNKKVRHTSTQVQGYYNRHRHEKRTPDPPLSELSQTLNTIWGSGLVHKPKRWLSQKVEKAVWSITERRQEGVSRNQEWMEHQISKKHPEWFVNLYRNMRSIFESVGKMEENDHLVNGIIEDWGMNNLEEKVLNHLLCDLQNQARFWSVFMGVWRSNNLQEEIYYYRRPSSRLQQSFWGWNRL